MARPVVSTLAWKFMLKSELVPNSCSNRFCYLSSKWLANDNVKFIAYPLWTYLIVSVLFIKTSRYNNRIRLREGKEFLSKFLQRSNKILVSQQKSLLQTTRYDQPLQSWSLNNLAASFARVRAINDPECLCN